MKRLIPVFVLAILLTGILSTTTHAKSGDVAPNGFYDFTIGKEESKKFIPLTSFLFMNQTEKIAIFIGDYYLILGDESYRTMDILGASTDAELEKKMLTVDQLKAKFNVEIDANGETTPAENAENKSFHVESIE